MATKQSTSSPAEINIDSIVNTEKASRGVWLVKVPRYLSNVWENKSGEAIGRLVVSNGETTFHSTITNDTESKKLNSAGAGLHNSTSIDKNGEPKSIDGKRQSTSSEIPLQHKFIIKDVQAGHQSLAVLSEDKTGLEEDAEFRTGKLSIEGRIVIRAECQPPNSTDYMRMKVRQIQRVSQPKKTVKQMERAVVKYKPVNAHAEHMNKDKAKREGKAVRLEKNEVVNLLFHAFEKHQFYRQSDLQKITNQPGSMIREVLNDIGLYHENAPHKAMWELKPEYRNYNKDLSKKVESKMQK